MELTRLKLTNYKNFRDVDVPLCARAFVVGPNAAGKSNLLDALRFLRDIANDAGGLQRAVQERQGFSAIRSLHARQNQQVAIEVHLGDAETSRTVWKYRISLTCSKAGTPLVAEEVVTHEGPGVIYTGPDIASRKDEELLLRTALEQPHTNQLFREVKRFLDSIHYLHLVPQIIRARAPMNGDFQAFGSTFLEDVLSAHHATRRSRLDRIREAMRPAVPNLEELEIRRDPKTGAPHLHGRFAHWRPKAGWHDESQFSDGTLRLVGLLWTAMDGEGPLLLEEPELSLHPHLVRLLPSALWQLAGSRGRQVIMSTHSLDLLTDETIAPGELLLVRPTAEGSTVVSAADDELIRATMEAGVLASDVASSEGASRLQLGLFDNDRR